MSVARLASSASIRAICPANVAIIFQAPLRTALDHMTSTGVLSFQGPRTLCIRTIVVAAHRVTGR
ncbi:hypothetical protein BRAS3843_330066 [Bradyrhizobium sp. STM 3843]|nr:hypothetical protein BRAS3843_330066 [Bradyrhizobium sp. STM 3843]